jgi:hypothetical protein
MGRAHDFHLGLYMGRSIGNLAPPDLARASVARVLTGHSLAGTGSPALRLPSCPAPPASVPGANLPPGTNLRSGSGCFETDPALGTPDPSICAAGPGAFSPGCTPPAPRAAARAPGQGCPASKAAARAPGQGCPAWGRHLRHRIRQGQSRSGPSRHIGGRTGNLRC